MNLLEESLRMKKLMMLEQTSEESYLKDFASGNFDKLREVLLTNQELLEKVKKLLGSKTAEESEELLMKPNKTIIMRGMADAKAQKDMDFYKFLEVILKNVD